VARVRIRRAKVGGVRHNARGQVLTAKDPLQTGTTTLGYVLTGIGRDNPTSVTDPNGKTTTAVYDGAGRLTAVTDPLRNTTTDVPDGIGLREPSLTRPMRPAAGRRCPGTTR
jgi:YD repeat-containing protein